jgi:hypothetical protein
MDDKKFYRILKREVKRKGNRKRRNFLKRGLSQNPNEAHWDEYLFKSGETSKWLNRDGWQTEIE